MPLRQYFIWVGSILLAALFVTDWCFPASVREPVSELAPNERVNLRIRSDHKWPERVVFDTGRVSSTNAANANTVPDGGPGTRRIHPQYLNSLVSERADDDAVFSCDVGTPVAWAARYLEMNGRRRLIGSFNHGSMANAMLQAIGAQADFPKRQVISLSGDGGFTMMMGEFVTLIQHRLPVKIIVLNNGTLGFVELEMKASGFVDSGCDLENPDFAEVARAMGIKGVRVESPQDVRAAVEEVLRHDGPALLDVVTPRQELVLPPTKTFDQAQKFGTFMLRAVLDGRARELVDLADVNLRR